MTFWRSKDNYGQLLQCYALQRYLHDAGHEAFLIRYNFEKDIVHTQTSYLRKIKQLFSVRKLFSILKSRIIAKNRLLNQKGDRKFDSFRQEYIVQSIEQYSTLKELQENPPQADIYIVGSDQVWNCFSTFDQYRNVLHAYFLDFGPNHVKRMSYAASWGRTTLPKEQMIEISPLLRRFDYISVRENSGIELCNNCGRNDAEWVCDPTLLLSADVYRKLYNSCQINKENKKYLFLYLLNSSYDSDVQAIYNFAKSKELEVVYVTGNGRNDNYFKHFATIPEWLYYVDNAEYVITNSFHCGVFSTIFHKQFGIIPLMGKLEQMNSRFYSLFEMKGTGNRFIDNANFEVLDKEYQAKDVKVSYNFLRICTQQ